MSLSLRITDEGVEIVSPEPLPLEKLREIFLALRAQGLGVKCDELAGDDQPLDSRLIKGRLCG
jgi:hypothetical protein